MRRNKIFVWHWSLLKHERDRLDAFHVACLRKILRIPHSMISHITNQTVLERAGENCLSQQLRKKQIVLFGRIAAQPSDSVIRNTIFQPGSFKPKVFEGQRCRGRPRMTWAHVMAALALEVTAGSHQKLQSILSLTDAVQEWRPAVKQHLAQLGN